MTNFESGLVDRNEDLLDAARILAGLSPATRNAVAALDVLASIDSTNSELLRRRAARDGVSVLFAETQTGGRGRQGRVWVSPPHYNLYVSIARHLAVALPRLSGLSLVVGVAVVEALHAFGATGIGLKWPNDLVVADDGGLRKLGGILVESGGAQEGGIRVVIGLGLNVRMPEISSTDRDANSDASAGARTGLSTCANTNTSIDAPTIDQPWTDLQQLLGAGTPPRNIIAAAVLETLLPALQRFEREGLAPALERYARFDALRGRTLETRGGTQTLIGIADGLAEDGALRLRTANGEVLLRAGEVSVRASEKPA